MFAALALSMLLSWVCAQSNTNVSSLSFARFNNTTTGTEIHTRIASPTTSQSRDGGSAGALFAHTENTALHLETPAPPTPSVGPSAVAVTDESANGSVVSDFSEQPQLSPEQDQSTTASSEAQKSPGPGASTSSQVSSPPLTTAAVGNALASVDGGPAQMTPSTPDASISSAPQATQSFTTTLSYAAPPLNIGGQVFTAAAGNGRPFYDINGASLAPGGVVTATIGGMLFQVSLTPDAADLVLVIEDGQRSGVATYSEMLQTGSSSPTGTPSAGMDQTSNAETLASSVRSIVVASMVVLGLGFAHLAFA